MRAIYINDGSIQPRKNQDHWVVIELFGEQGAINTIDEGKGIFEFIPDKELYQPNLVKCNREEIHIIK